MCFQTADIEHPDDWLLKLSHGGEQQRNNFYTDGSCGWASWAGIWSQIRRVPHGRVCPFWLGTTETITHTSCCICINGWKNMAVVQIYLHVYSRPSFRGCTHLQVILLHLQNICRFNTKCQWDIQAPRAWNIVTNRKKYWWMTRVHKSILWCRCMHAVQCTAVTDCKIYCKAVVSGDSLSACNE